MNNVYLKKEEEEEEASHGPPRKPPENAAFLGADTPRGCSTTSVFFLSKFFSAETPITIITQRGHRRARR